MRKVLSSIGMIVGIFLAILLIGVMALYSTTQENVFTILLFFIYFGCVVLMQTAILLFTGQGRSEIVTVISTLAIAGLLIPLQERVQIGIDRRFIVTNTTPKRPLPLLLPTWR